MFFCAVCWWLLAYILLVYILVSCRSPTVSLRLFVKSIILPLLLKHLPSALNTALETCVYQHLFPPSRGLLAGQLATILEHPRPERPTPSERRVSLMRLLRQRRRHLPQARPNRVPVRRLYCQRGAMCIRDGARLLSCEPRL